jgi:D-arabinose 1-dehydrogenase-like Zn-dependent alcohol dehydrogenase
MIPGQKVLIHGAAGGVGSFAIQLEKSGGLLVSATCGTANVAYVRSLGADRVIDHKTEDVCRAVRDGAGYDRAGAVCRRPDECSQHCARKIPPGLHHRLLPRFAGTRSETRGDK